MIKVLEQFNMLALMLTLSMGLFAVGCGGGEETGSGEGDSSTSTGQDEGSGSGEKFVATTHLQYRIPYLSMESPATRMLSVTSATLITSKTRTN